MNLSFENKSVIIKENLYNPDNTKLKILNLGISSQYKKDKIIISMKYKNERSINLFGTAFLKNNHNKKCRIIYEGKKKELRTKINPDKNNKDFIKVKLIIYDNLVSIGEMFCGCQSLISINNLENL